MFSSKDGAQFEGKKFLKPLQRAARRAGIEKRIDIHTLRHSYGSNKIRLGWGLRKVSKLLGHADITITAKVYSHLLDGDLKVRDEVQFDNSGVEANSDGKADLIAQLDSPESLVTMIQFLQSCLHAKKCEESRNMTNVALTSAEIPASCDANATRSANTGTSSSRGAQGVLKLSKDIEKLLSEKVVRHHGFEPWTLTLKV